MKRSLIALLLLSSTAFAGEGMGSGVRGGGRTVDINNIPYLRDLVTKTVCDWNEGNELFEANPSLKTALARLARLDWYFAAELEREIKALDFCLTGRLNDFYVWEQPGTVRRDNRAYLTAYRLNENVYVNAERFWRMPEDNRAMLLVHEAMHSFLDMRTFERQLKLESMVKTIDQVARGQIITRKKLHFSMEKNDITFPTSVALLDSKKDVVLFLLGTIEEQVEKVKATLKPETLIDLTPEQIAAMDPWHRAHLENGEGQSILKEALLGAMLDASPAEIQMILDRKVYEKINPALIALEEFHTFSEEQRKAVLTSKSFAKGLSFGFERLLKAEITYENFLIHTNLLNPVSVPLLTIRPEERLPDYLIWLPEMMIQLEALGQLTHVLKDETFYRALGLKAHKEAVSAISVRIEREKKIATERLNLLSKSLVENLMKRLRERVDQPTFEAIEKQIDTTKF